MATAETDQIMEDPCPSCGSMVRRGLVRCWSCGAFMRSDIAARYEEMQQKQPDVAFKPLPEHATSTSAADQAVTAAKPSSSEPPKVANPSSSPAGRGGFAMPGLAPAEGDFQLGAEFTGQAPEEGSRRSVSAFSGGRRAGGEPVEQPAESSPAPADTAAEAPRKPRRPPADSDGPAHSEATAGDVLLQVALQEEMESARRGRGGRAVAFDPVRVADGWMITCPCPARIRIKVKEAHRGKTGKCPNPNCGSSFTVPADLPSGEDDAEVASTDVAAPADAGLPADPAEKAGPFTHWLRDVRLHVVKPAKARRKPGGHEQDFRPADVGFSKAEGMAVLALTTKPAGLLGKKKKPEQVREEVLSELRNDKPVAELSIETKLQFEPDVLGKAIVEFPPAYEHESTFAGIPVFGEGRIAVKLPPAGAPDEQHFISLTLSQYRRLHELLEGLLQVEQFGVGCPIPGDDELVHLVCHYSEDPLDILRNPVFHRADPEMVLDVVGYRCESCGLIVSEGSRRKEKIGGLEGKKLASAKCPKCKGKFGNSPLFAIKPHEEAPAAAATDADSPPAESSVD